MSVAYRNKRINSYFRLMKNWDTESKKDLIIRLTKSINDKDETKYDFSSCFGAWDDERSADEIIEEIRSSRMNNREIEDF